MTAPEPTQPLTESCPTCSGPTRETTHMICLTCGTDFLSEPPRRVTGNALEVLRASLAEVDRLRSLIKAFLEPHELIQRNIAWTDEKGVLHVTEHSVCGHCVPQFAHFNRREDIPEGPCPIRVAFALDQSGEGQANATE